MPLPSGVINPKLKIAMTSKNTTNPSFVTQLREQIEYCDTGTFNKVLLKDQACQYTLLCLAPNTEISEHKSTRNATVNVIEGRGVPGLTLIHHSEKNRRACVVSAYGKSSFRPSLTKEG